MKRKSFGKWAIVALLAVALLLSLCGCSKSEKKAQTTTTTATTPTATTTAPAAPVQEEKKAEAPVAAPEPTPAPVVEPVVEAPVVEAPVVEEPVAETPKAEEPVVEEVVEAPAIEVPAFSTLITVEGLSAQVEAYSDHAKIVLPAGTTAADVQFVASKFLAAYPQASVVKYTLDGEILNLSYPAQSDAVIRGVVAQMESDIKWAVKQYKAAAAPEVKEVVEVAEEPAPVVEDKSFRVAEDGTIIAWYNYRGLAEAKIEVGATKAVITYPSYLVYKSDIDTVAALAVAELPYLANVITYSIPEEGTLVITYPDVLSLIEKTNLLATLNEQVSSYIDSVLKTFIAEAPAEEPAEEKVEEEAPVVAPVFSTIIATHGMTANVVAYSDYAEITVPAGTTKADVDAVAAALVKAYPVAAACQYAFDGAVVTVSYPAQSDAFVVAAVKQLESDAKWAADQLFGKAVAKAEEAPAEAKVEEAPVVAPVFSTIIATHGMTANVVAYSDYAEITVPAGTTKADVDAVAAALVKAYPVAAACQYAFDGAVVTVSYPAQSDAFVVAAVKQLESDAKWAADQLFGKAVAKAEEAPAPAPAKVEEAPVVAVAEAPAAKVEEAPAPAPAKVEEAPVVAVAEAPAPAPAPVPVAEPKAVETVKKFSVDLSAKAALNFEYDTPFVLDLDAKFGYNINSKFTVGASVGYALDGYVPIKAFGRYNITDNVYAFANAGYNIGLDANKDKSGVIAGFGVGYEYALKDNISLFGEAGADILFGRDKAFVPGITVGAKVTF